MAEMIAQRKKVVAGKRKRGRAKRVVEPVVYGTEIRDMYRFVTDTTGLKDRKKAVKIDGDALRVMDDILRQVEAKTLQEMEKNADPARETLFRKDLLTTVRKAFIFTEAQEELAHVCDKAMEATKD
jgi:hypothetical protein